MFIANMNMILLKYFEHFSLFPLALRLLSLTSDSKSLCIIDSRELCNLLYVVYQNVILLLVKHIRFYNFFWQVFQGYCEYSVPILHMLQLTDNPYI
jgi:hypothetical protein